VRGLAFIGAIVLTVMFPPQPRAQGEVRTWGEPIGQVGGSVAAILPWQGERVLIGYGPRLAILHLTGGADGAPSLEAIGPVLGEPIRSLALGGDWVLVAEGTRVSVVSALAPTSAPVGTVDVGAVIWEIQPHGAYAYARTTAGLTVVDVRAPTRPAVLPLDLLQPGDHVVDHLIVSQRLLVTVTDEPDEDPATRRAELVVFDVDEPLRPLLVNRTADPAWAVLASGGSGSQTRLFAAGAGLIEADLSARDAPAIVRRYTDFAPRWGGHLIVSPSGIPYLAETGIFGGTLVNTPDDSGGGAREVAIFRARSAGGFAAVGERLVLAESGGRIDVIDPRHSVPAATLDLVGDVAGVSVDDSSPDAVHFVAHEGGYGVLDIMDQALPTLHRFVYDGHYHSGGLDAGDGVALVSDTGEGDALRFRYDVYVEDSDGAITIQKSITPACCVAAVRAGQRAFGLAEAPATVGMWNLAGLHEAPMSTFEVPGTVKHLDVLGSRLAVIRFAEHERPFEPRPQQVVLDLLDVRSPAIRTGTTSSVGDMAISDSSEPAVALSRDHAFVTLPEGRFPAAGQLVIVDLESLATVGKLALEHAPHDLRYYGGFLFASGSGQVIDVRDPLAPAIVAAQHGTGGMYSHLDVADGLVFVAAGNAGVEIYRPDLPWQAQPQPSPTPADHLTDVRVEGVVVERGTGAPIADALVVATANPGICDPPETSGVDGRFALVCPWANYIGTITVDVTAEGYLPWTTTCCRPLGLTDLDLRVVLERLPRRAYLPVVRSG
jgi:hypothetical protein